MRPYDQSFGAAARRSYVHEVGDGLEAEGYPSREPMTNGSIRHAVAARSRDGGASIAPISRWNVSEVTDFSYHFADMPNFNADISSWDTSSAVTMRGMFQNCRMFNRNISNWDVSRVVDMTSMFEGARVQQEPQSMERSRRYVRQHAARSTRATGPPSIP